jgi:shikimate kinase
VTVLDQGNLRTGSTVTTPAELPPAGALRRPIERVVLLGFMGSGKSTVGEALARRLEWRYLDFDVEIERREDAAVSAIIRAKGEEYFRAAEAALTREVAELAGVVLSPGGGWITQPEMLEMIRPGTFAAWLRVSPEETVRRLRSDPIDRPLRDLPDAIPRVAEMLADREPLYRLADAIFPGDGVSAELVAFEIEQMVRTRGIVKSEG